MHFGRRLAALQIGRWEKMLKKFISLFASDTMDNFFEMFLFIYDSVFNIKQRKRETEKRIIAIDSIWQVHCKSNGSFFFLCAKAKN